MAQTSQNVKWWPNSKKYSKIVFSSFWYDLRFGSNFFLVRIQVKKYLKIDFTSFWHDRGFGGSLFLFKIDFKQVFKNSFFQLLARSWFWWQLVSFQNQLRKYSKLLSPAFVRMTTR